MYALLLPIHPTSELIGDYTHSDVIRDQYGGRGARSGPSKPWFDEVRLLRIMYVFHDPTVDSYWYELALCLQDILHWGTLRSKELSSSRLLGLADVGHHQSLEGRVTFGGDGRGAVDRVNMTPCGPSYGVTCHAAGQVSDGWRGGRHWTYPSIWPPGQHMFSWYCLVLLWCKPIIQCSLCY